MEETINISALTLANVVFTAATLGITAGIILCAKYMPKRKRRMVAADAELKRLAEWLQKHHPERVSEGPVVDKVINMLADSKTPEQWRLQ
jgi:hypothetical protein